jgi:hypothetical protein
MEELARLARVAKEQGRSNRNDDTAPISKVA